MIRNKLVDSIFATCHIWVSGIRISLCAFCLDSFQNLSFIEQSTGRELRFGNVPISYEYTVGLDKCHETIISVRRTGVVKVLLVLFLLSGNVLIYFVTNRTQ